LKDWGTKLRKEKSKEGLRGGVLATIPEGREGTCRVAENNQREKKTYHYFKYLETRERRIPQWIKRAEGSPARGVLFNLGMAIRGFEKKKTGDA